MGKQQRMLILILFFSILFLSQHARADIEWSLKKQLKLEATPLDIASSVDGRWIFVLTPGEILVYSKDDTLVKRIPVDKTFDHLTYTVPDRTLIVSSSAEKTVKIIELEVVHHFSLQDLPFEGRKDAPVALVVFSDYQ